MISALLYLQFHSFKNRALFRLKRMKQPKYILSGIVGALYFYFYFYRWLFAANRPRSVLPVASSPETLALYEALGALALFAIVLLAWIIPHQRAALSFTEAEVAFLFPAPVSRRGLVHFKLLRSQTAILLTTILLTLVTNRFGGHPWIRGAGWWLILSILNLHFLGSSFARTMLTDRGISNWKRRVGILGLVLAAAGATFFWARRTLPALRSVNLENLEAIQNYIQQLLVSGPVPYLLFPFRLVIRPFLAPNASAFISALGPALLLMVAHYWWVILSNVAFEEASVEASRRLAERVAANRAGAWPGTKKSTKRKPAPFPLRPIGPPAVALLWKNLISAGQAFTVRIWIMLVAIGFGACAALRNTAEASGIAPAVGLVACLLIPWSLLIGPQFLRQDFRQDLMLVDVLKTFPMRGWQIVLGEILAPAVILTGIHWILLLIAVGGLSQSSGDLAFIPGWRTSLAAAMALAMILPMLNLIVLQIPNAAVLVFPAWFQAAKDGPHGIEATGQRLIFVLGQLVVFILALLPASAVGLGVYFLAWRLVGMTAALFLTGVFASLVLAIEAALGFFFLGSLFERFDLSSELSP